VKGVIIAVAAPVKIVFFIPEHLPKS
jgi:hypothetical protein